MYICTAFHWCEFRDEQTIDLMTQTALYTKFAFKWLFSSVCSKMYGQMIRAPKTLCTLIAFVRFFACMSSAVINQVVLLKKSLKTLSTCVWLLFGVSSEMKSQLWGMFTLALLRPLLRWVLEDLLRLLLNTKFSRSFSN